MSRVLFSVLALALVSAPIAVAAQTSEPAGTPRVVYHPAPDDDERPSEDDTDRATSRERRVEHRTPPRAHRARGDHARR